LRHGFTLGMASSTKSVAAQLKWAKGVFRAESSAIAALEQRLTPSFVKAIDALDACRGRVVVTAIGKPGFVAQKLSATLASIGVASHFLHPAEAAHGDLGRVVKGDVVVALSNSGATEEVLRLVQPLNRLKVKLMVIVGDVKSPLAQKADIVIGVGRVDEACPMGLVPTASTAALLAMADALAMTLAWRRQVTTSQYARFHPGGKLGRSVLTVGEVMRTGAANPLVSVEATVGDALMVMTNTKGRPGAALVVRKGQALAGIFTDGDLRRMAERGLLNFDQKIESVMCKRPQFVSPQQLVLEAANLMRETKVDQLPVVDAAGRAVGLLDVQDVLAARVV
jgi:arabinose-5-phosphate isomerase